MNSSKTFSINEKGVAHVLIIILLLLGLAVGVWLVGQRAGFFSQASSNPISGPIYAPLPSPIAYWRFDNTFQDSTVHDSAGSSNGTWVGLSNVKDNWTTGYHNGGGLFTNNTSNYRYVNIGTPATLDHLLTGDFTITGWVKPNSLTDANLVSRGDSKAALQNKFIIVAISGGKLWFGIRGDSGEPKSTYVSGTQNLTVGNWYHFAVVRKKGSTMSVYTNGTNVAAATDTAGNVTFVNWYGLRSLTLGVGGVEAGKGGFFDGVMDEVKIYNTALSSDQIVADLNSVTNNVPSPTPTLSPTSTPVATNAPTSTPVASSLPSSTPTVDQRISNLESELAASKQQQAATQSQLDKVLNWLKSVFPSFQ